MPFDGLVMSAVASELADLLTGGRIEKIQQPGPSELILAIHTRKNGKQKLLISANARDARIHLTTGSYVNPIAPPIFCMVLRKHLEGGRIRSVEQVALERVLKFSIDSRDELGRPGEKLLFCEVMGKHSNILLVDPANNTVVDGIHRYSHSVSRYREVLPNRPYLPPPKQDKLDPRELSEEKFKSAILDDDLDSSVANILLKKLSGVGPQTCRELVVRADMSIDYKLEHCGDYELTQLWNQIKWVANLIEENNFTPTLLLGRRGKPLDFAAFDLSHIKAFERINGSMSLVLDQYYIKVTGARLLEGHQQSLLQTIRKETSRLKKKISLYHQSLKTAENADQYRKFGELLTANLYQLEQGSEAKVQDFYDSEAKDITITLDPSLTPSQNAQSYFKRYLKAKNTKDSVNLQMEQALSELAYLEAVEIAVLQAVDIEDLTEIRLELEEQAYLKPKTQQGKVKAKKEQERPKPLSFVSSDCITILVGKNNKQNDYLTLRLAAEEDIWLHTKDIPGSHVIIRCSKNGGVPEQTLLEAATIAAWHSKARQSGKVPVDYTPKRNVRKPKGAKPGMVIYDNQKTLYVTPDEELVDRLIRLDS